MPNVATRFQPDISGSAVPSGFVGEVLTATKTTATTGSTTRASYTTLVTLSNLTAGTWKLEATLGYYSITGSANDTAGTAYGSIFSARIYNSTDASVVISCNGNLAKSTVNSGYIAGGNITLTNIISISSAKTYVFDFAYESNSGANTETVTGLSVAASASAPVVLRAIRII